MDATIRVAELGASRGARWIGESWRLFRAAPLAWIGLCGGWLAVTFALLLVPFLGGVVANFLQPVFFASFAIAAYRQSAGEPLTMGDLFSGFRRNMRALVNLGAIMLIAEIAIFAVMGLLGLPIARAGDESMTVAELAEQLADKEWIILLGLGLMTLVKGALWFAPQLIAFHGMDTTQAIRWSVYAAISNLGALLVYGVLLVLIFIAGALPWLIGLVVVLPLVVISTYVGYHEVFETAPAAVPTPQ